MIRTIITLDENAKAWLEQRAKLAGVSMSELVREAIRRMRQQEEASFEQLLEQTSGIWQKGDGLAYQRRLRKE